jgi:putative nucleotidyltransferase with HDIG domain
MADILFVDDEQSILNALKRVFRDFNGHTSHFADSPQSALEVLTTHHIDVLVSDHKMPQMTGAMFLSRVKEKRPDTVRIMLTGQADLDAVQLAVNSGEIFRFILKPWNDDELRQSVRSAVEYGALNVENRRLQELTCRQNEELLTANERLEDQVKLRTQQLADALHTAQALNVQLEDTLYAGTKALFNLIQMARPDLGTHSRRVADAAVAMSRQCGFNERDLKAIEISALLHDCGKLSMPTYIMDKNPKDYSKEEQDLYRIHPIVGIEVLKGISYFNEVCTDIRTHHERYDGSGFPHGERGTAITRRAYIVGLADEYDHLMNRPNADQEFRYQYACERISEFADKQFPNRLVQMCLDYAEKANHRRLSDDEMRVGFADLMPNVTLCRDVYTMTGSLLVARGATLTAQNIARMRAITKLDPIAGDIYVVRRAKRAPVGA